VRVRPFSLVATIALASLACGARSHAPKSETSPDAGAEDMSEDAASFLAPDGKGAQSSGLDAIQADAIQADAPLPVDTNASEVAIKSVCGNGVIESGEECDPPGSCPTTCPNRGCTRFVLQGSASGCTAVCVSMGTESRCMPDDGCCPAGCDANSDRDCLIKCDNGVKEGSETCDPLSSCPTTCPAVGCQLRKLINAGTCTAECVNDRQQTACKSGDGCCPSACNNNNDGECAPKCGNGVVEVGETCDPVSSCMSKQAACVDDADFMRTPSGDAASCTFKCTETARACGAAVNQPCCSTGCKNGLSCQGGVCCAANAGQSCLASPCYSGTIDCTGSCVMTVKPDGSPCGQLAHCSGVTTRVAADTCKGGSCQAGAQMSCPAFSSCTGTQCVCDPPGRVDTNGACCGSEGGPCCSQGSACGGNALRCDVVGQFALPNTCVACGDGSVQNSACCGAADSTGTCNAGSVCHQIPAGRWQCDLCGALGQRCCAGDACNAGLSCQPPTGHPPTAHCG
jgi:hypothetical protein